MPDTKPVQPGQKVDGQLAVAEDLDFQRKWWRFENVVWTFFALLILADISGLFGRGYLAKAHAATPDSVLMLDYERVERTSTPSIMTLHFSPAAPHQGNLQVFVSNSVNSRLGAQRILPQPVTSTLSDGGVTYTFPAAQAPTTVQIALEPAFPGLQKFSIQLSGEPAIARSVFVVP